MNGAYLEYAAKLSAHVVGLIPILLAVGTLPNVERARDPSYLRSTRVLCPAVMRGVARGMAAGGASATGEGHGVGESAGSAGARHVPC